MGGPGSRGGPGCPDAPLLFQASKAAANAQVAIGPGAFMIGSPDCNDAGRRLLFSRGQSLYFTFTTLIGAVSATGIPSTD